MANLPAARPMDGNGIPIIGPTDGQKATFVFSRSTFAIAATPTDIAIINGSSSGKIVRITRIEIDALCTAPTASALEVQLIKRTSANSGGTTTGSPAGVAYDSNDGSPTAQVLCYTGNPSGLGTSAGIVRDGKIVPVLSPFTATDFPQHDKLIWDFGNRPEKALVLNSATEGYAINLAGATIPAGLSMGISIEVTEE
ncbi:MAG TPA: hypothetical protein VFN23_10520 [Ktedonobacteraceae bacterium]|nr:hypothetical protein [Ktedonobacteraceae bacterium]